MSIKTRKIHYQGKVEKKRENMWKMWGYFRVFAFPNQKKLERKGRKEEEKRLFQNVLESNRMVKKILEEKEYFGRIMEKFQFELKILFEW